MKACTACKHTKPLDEFYRVHSRPGTLTARCRACIKVEMRSRRAAWTEPTKPCSEKRCGKCGITKPRAAFGRLIGTGTGLHSWCRACCATAARARRQGNPDGVRHVKYRMPRGMYDELRAKQQGRCAICKRDDRVLAVDHDHSTGEIRGLLCRRCNSAIGFLGDSAAMAYSAAQYLASHQVKGEVA